MAEDTYDLSTDFQRFDPGPSPLLRDLSSERDVDMTEDTEMTGLPSERLIIAIDFGTTFSSVAYARVNASRPAEALGLSDVKCITRYPGDMPVPGVTFTWEPREDVPTELWYRSDSASEVDISGDVSMDAGEDISSDTSNEDSELSSESGSESAEELDYNGNNQEKLDPLFWGFQVQKQLQKIDIPKDGARRLTRFKLMLDEGSATQNIREELAPVLKNLKKSKLIEKDVDVISDYLQQLFRHTREELYNLNEAPDDVPIEYVLCVPAVWPSKACRVMQAAMSTAIKRSGLGVLVDDSLDNLFIVSEPEAAATCVLAEDNNDIYNDETIVILDAGGGTVDAVTYRVTNSYPLRLSSEVVAPYTEVCGASFINQRLQSHLLKRLKHETYLVKNGKTIKSIVEGKVIEFENGVKRIINTCNEEFEMDPIYIDDLKPNLKKRLSQNRLGITRRDMVKLFQPSLDGVASVLRQQLEMAKAKGCSVQKIILIGGFGQSPSLQSYLKDVVKAETNLQGQEIQLLIPRTPSTAVSRGAVLRALNKEAGPERITSCSYGFLRTEPYEPLVFAAHKNTKCIIDKADGERYVDSTIDWLIQKGDRLPSNKEFTVKGKHTFVLNRKTLICEEKLMSRT